MSLANVNAPEGVFLLGNKARWYRPKLGALVSFRFTILCYRGFIRVFFMRIEEGKITGFKTEPAIEPVTFRGYEVTDMPSDLQRLYAGTISDTLAGHPDHMGFMPQQKVLDAMSDGLFTLRVDIGDPDWGLLACARDLGTTLPDPEEFDLPRETGILATWFGTNGNGRTVLLETASWIAEKPQIHAVAALIGTGNRKALNAALAAGGVDKGTRASERVVGREVTIVELPVKKL